MEYDTWYEFKRECEKRLGHSLLNQTWLRVKPETALPWDDSKAIMTTSKVRRLRRVARDAQSFSSQRLRDVTKDRP